jgi:DNA-binding transcriptional LysR family regulator
VQFLFHQGDYSSIQEWVRIGAVDFGFMTPAAVTGLETITIKDGRMLALLPKNHKLASHSHINLQEIADEPFILLEEGDFSEPMEAFRAGNLEPNIKYRIHDDYAIMTMVEAGLGVSILAELVLRRTNFNIVALPIDPPITRTIAIGYKDKDSLPIASKYFIEYLTSNSDKLP